MTIPPFVAAGPPRQASDSTPEWLRQQAARFLEPGEQLLAGAQAQLDPVVPERVPKRYRRPGQPDGQGRDGLIRVLQPAMAVWAVLGDAGAGWDGLARRIRRVFHGAGWHGGWDSQAGRFVVAVRCGPRRTGGYEHQWCALAFTDRRLMLLSSDLSPQRHSAEPIGQLPYGSFALRPAAPPRRQSRRVDIVFDDGSWVGLEAYRPGATQLRAWLGAD